MRGGRHLLCNHHHVESHRQQYCYHYGDAVTGIGRKKKGDQCEKGYDGVRHNDEDDIVRRPAFEIHVVGKMDERSFAALVMNHVTCYRHTQIPLAVFDEILSGGRLVFLVTDETNV